MNTTRSAPDWKGSLLELDVESVAHGGHCVARCDGRVVFVRHTLPGERVLAEVTEDRGGSFCRANAVQVLVAAPGRVEPPCPLARPNGCGGCDWQHASAETQRELKAAVVAEQLERLAGLEWPVHVEELPGGLLGWRSRVRLGVTFSGRAGLRENREHRVIPVDDCPISVPDMLSEVLPKAWTRGAELAVAKDAEGIVHATEMRILPGGRPRMQRMMGGGQAVEYAAGRKWLLQAHSFWQVHPAAADTLASVVGEWARASPGAHVWDLYSGVGLFASVLAGQVGPDGSVLAVESAKLAAADAMMNLEDLPQVRVIRGKVRQVLADEGARPEVVVLDPPRRGAGRPIVDTIAERGPSTVVYVACDPASLARDIARFATHGYRLADLRAFDAFPMTQHVECVARLTADAPT
ncbi:MAG: TRAM domain-containing protein [Pseudonocardiaceae bacterium]|nr:TRAM domain-containing protein [Pseudonocardiaceae bacterium]